MKWRNCLWCGGPLKALEYTDSYKCQLCGKTLYDNPKAASGVFLFNKAKTKVYLCLRTEDPGKGKIDVIGGFLNAYESLETGTYRELEEETGLTRADVSELIYAGSDGSPYVWEGSEVYVCAIYFSAIVKDPTKMKPGDDVEEIISYAKGDLKREEFAWPAVYDILMQAW